MPDYHSTALPASPDGDASEPMTLEFAETMREAVKEGFPDRQIAGHRALVVAAGLPREEA
jgi:hypothetical protein